MCDRLDQPLAKGASKLLVFFLRKADFVPILLLKDL